jgi:WD40 repeat protein
MKLAEVALAEGNAGRARVLLDAYAGKQGAGDLRSFEWGYFRGLAQGSQTLSLQGHSNAIMSLVFAPDGKTLASAGFDGWVKLWDFPSMKLRSSISVSNVNFTSVSFSSDGGLVAAATSRDGVFLWTSDLKLIQAAPTGACVRAVFAPSGDTMALCQGGYLTSDKTGSVRIWDGANRKVSADWPGTGDRTAWTPDGLGLFIGASERGVSLYDVRSREMIRSYPSAGVLQSLVCSPDGKILAVSETTGLVRLWNVDDGRLIREFHAHAARVWATTFSPDGRSFATVSTDRTVRLWDVQTGVCSKTLYGHGNEVWSAAYSPDGQTLVTADKDGAIFLWNVNPAPVKETSSDIPEFNEPWIFSPDGESVAIGIGHHRVGVLNARTGLVKQVLEPADRALRFSPDGNGLSTVSSNAIVEFGLSTRARRIVNTFSEPLGNYTYAAVSSDGAKLALGNAEGRISLWSVASGNLLDSAMLEFGANGPWLSFSPDGQSLAATRWDAPFAWIFSDGLKKVTRLKGHKLYVWAAVFSADGKWIATTSMDDTAKVWNRASGKEFMTLTGHNEGAYGTAFSPDSRTLAVCCGNRKIKLWNLDTGREMGDLDTGNRAVYLDFSPDGRTLITYNPWWPEAWLRFWHSDLLLPPSPTLRRAGQPR